MVEDNEKKILEVEGGFIAKVYDSRGSVVARSEVVATAEEAEAAEVTEVPKAPVEEGVADAPEEAATPSEGEGETPNDGEGEGVAKESDTPEVAPEGGAAVDPVVPADAVEEEVAQPAAV